MIDVVELKSNRISPLEKFILSEFFTTTEYHTDKFPTATFYVKNDILLFAFFSNNQAFIISHDHFYLKIYRDFNDIFYAIDVFSFVAKTIMENTNMIIKNCFLNNMKNVTF